MKYVLIIFLPILISCNCNSQSPQANELDSLSKYSYLLEMGINGSLEDMGTGFFIRNNGKLYLLSNFHNFTGWHTFKNERAFDLNTMTIRLFEKETNNPYFLTIDVKKIRDTSKHHYYYDEPDIFHYEMPDSIERNYKIYSIEQIILTNIVKTQTPQEVFFYGFYPESVVTPSQFYSVKPIHKMGNVVGDISQKIFYKNIERYDSLNYRISLKNKGGSGTPVFFRYKKDDEPDRITFGGVVFGNFPQLEQTIIIRPNVVAEYILRHCK